MGGWRARWAGGAVAVCLLALTACSQPAGVDGNLTDNWSGFPDPQAPVPVVGTCQDGSVNPWNTADPPLLPADCSASHVLEVVYVGRFSATASAASTPPARDSNDSRTAYAECDRATRDFLGGDWHDGRLFLRYSPPTTAKWQGGARFFSCSLFETGSMKGNSRGRAGSLKGALSGDRPLAMRCFNEVGTLDADGFYDPVDDALPIDCGIAHSAEYAGAYVPPDLVYPATDTAVDRMRFDGCEQVAANFLGLSLSALASRPDITYLAWGPNKYYWPLGDRAITCLVTVSSKHLVHDSLKQIGKRPLPA
ncbi:MAG TPA: septum formation family protein [Planosporangium sp.]|nr:septum formation family protein [Planosporangium sp.]